LKKFITIEQPGFDDAVYPIDTAEEIAAAQAALRDAGIAEAPILYGEAGEPDTYRSGRTLLAADASA